LTDLRIGLGIDAHAFADGIPLMLAGVQLDEDRGLAGHSDGDVVTHALIDALLGAAGLGDIGTLFPSEDDSLQGVSSLLLLRNAYGKVTSAGLELVNADCILIGEQPRIADRRDDMRARLADTMGVERERVAVRATTTDRLGFTGRGEGLAAQAVALLRKSD
jgi:2-C-methyl-D-erythritol 2,4-cyclodiphosphate synthase